MLKKIKKNAFNLTVMVLTFVSMVAFSLLSVNVSSIAYILIFGIVGLSVYAVKEMSAASESRGGEEE
jgi:chromate transport protein ChrA